MIKSISIAAATLMLTGCLATTDLLKERGALPDELFKVGVRMVNLAQSRCIKISGPQDKPKDEWAKGPKLDGEWMIRRFYTSDTQWFKAETTSRGVWDSIYLNNSTGQFVCGDNSWNKFTNASGINFTEYGAKKNLLKSE
jgi:hypothetical protein